MFDRFRFFAIQPGDVEQCREWLEPFLKDFEKLNGLVTAEDVLTQAKECHAQLWSYHDGERFCGVVITRIHTLARGKVCSLWGCIGINGAELMAGFYEQLEAWARSIDCIAMEIVGRAGWERKLPGFKRSAVLLEKSLR